MGIIASEQAISVWMNLCLGCSRTGVGRFAEVLYVSFPEIEGQEAGAVGKRPGVRMKGSWTWQATGQDRKRMMSADEAPVVLASCGTSRPMISGFHTLMVVVGSWYNLGPRAVTEALTIFKRISDAPGPLEAARYSEK